MENIKCNMIDIEKYNQFGKLLSEKKDEPYELMLVTKDYIFYGLPMESDENGNTIMYNKKLELVSDNYFAYEGLIEDMIRYACESDYAEYMSEHIKEYWDTFKINYKEEIKEYKNTHMNSDSIEKSLYKDISAYKITIEEYLTLIDADKSCSIIQKPYLTLNDLSIYTDHFTELWDYPINELTSHCLEENIPVILVTDGEKERYFEIYEKNIDVVRTNISKIINENKEIKNLSSEHSQAQKSKISNKSVKNR